MRPIQKWAVGHINPKTNEVIAEHYRPYGLAKENLEDNLGAHCAYCEAWTTNPEIEHIIPKHQVPLKETLWENLLLACDRCNGKDNKSNKSVEETFTSIYFPHKHNTFKAFNYGEGGLVSINSFLINSQRLKAEALMNLVGLDKYPKNPKYADLKNDKRWMHRDHAWENAQRNLRKYEAGERAADSIAHLAAQRGFFSVWFTVFKAHQDVKAALIRHFRGTATNCFDTDFNPINRNGADI